MNHKKHILVLCGVLLSLSMTAWILDSLEEGKDSDVNLLFSFRPEQVTEILFQYPGQPDKPDVRLVKGEVWQLREPVRGTADFKVVTGFLHSLAGFRKGKEIATGSEKFAQYGLGNPECAVKVSWQYRGLTQTRTLLLGGDSVVGYGVYYRLREETGVWMGSRHLKLLLSKSIRDWRLREIIKIDVRTLTRFEFTPEDGNPGIFLASEQGLCREGRPQTCFRDRDIALLSEISGIRMEDFSDPLPPEAFSKFRYRLRWLQRGEESDSELLLSFIDGYLRGQYSNSRETLILPVSAVKIFEGIKRAAAD